MNTFLPSLSRHGPSGQYSVSINLKLFIPKLFFFQCKSPVEGHRKVNAVAQKRTKVSFQRA